MWNPCRLAVGHPRDLPTLLTESHLLDERNMPKGYALCPHYQVHLVFGKGDVSPPGKERYGS